MVIGGPSGNDVREWFDIRTALAITLSSGSLTSHNVTLGMHKEGGCAACGSGNGMLTVMAAPGKRLSDDLYSLYLAAIAWFLLPIYGNGLAVVLPSDVSGFERSLDVAAAASLVAAVWIGYRGGPFLINRSGVLYELQAPRPIARSLLPRLVRQAVAYAALAAISATVLLAMSDAENFGFAEAGRSSLVAIVAMVASVCCAVGWLVVFKAESARRWLLTGGNLAAMAAPVALVLLGESFFSVLGAAVLGGSLLLAVVVALLALDAVPVQHLWRRASVLEDMRSAMQSFDFQQVLVSLRRAVDHTEGRAKANLARPWMPLQLWRYLASIEHGWIARIAQFVLAGGVTAGLLVWADPADGVIALAIAGIGFLVGVELSSPVAATSGQMVFLVHYLKPSTSVLRRQTSTAVALGALLGLVATGWKVLLDPTVGLSVLGLFTFGTLAAAAQGRLGSPDLASLALTLGPSALGPILWARALVGPLLAVALTIAVSHGWLRPEELTAPWETLVLLVVLAAAVTATYPLEKRA